MRSSPGRTRGATPMSRKCKWAGFVGRFRGVIQRPAHAQPQQKPFWDVLDPIGPIGPVPGA